MKYIKELDVAKKLAIKAGKIINNLYESDDETLQIQLKRGVEPVTKADKDANYLIVNELKKLFPDDGILSEEAADDLERLNKSRLWIIDPLDGTKEFIAKNGEFAVMIGFVENGNPKVGAVFLPSKNKLYFAAEGFGAFLLDNEKETKLYSTSYIEPNNCKIVISRSHLHQKEQELIEIIKPTELIRSGSIGVKLGIIAEQKANLYLTATTKGIKEWDTCAPEIILREAGGAISDLTGSKLKYNKKNVLQSKGMIAAGTDKLRTNILHQIKGNLPF